MKNPRVPMQDMPIPEHQFQMVGIDTCGPFPESDKGNKYADVLEERDSSASSQHIPTGRAPSPCCATDV